MRKNNCGKSIMRIFAVIASIGGVIFLFRDKILACPIVQKFLASKTDCPLCSKLRQHHSQEEPTDVSEEEMEEEEAFDHAFDVDPAAEREYVSLNINSHKSSETVEE